MENSIENSKKRNIKYISKIYLSVFRALLIYLYWINKIEKDKAIRMSPDLIYLKMVEDDRYNVEN
jgi:hypothetical protein